MLKRKAEESFDVQQDKGKQQKTSPELKKNPMKRSFTIKKGTAQRMVTEKNKWQHALASVSSKINRLNSKTPIIEESVVEVAQEGAERGAGADTELLAKENVVKQNDNSSLVLLARLAAAASRSKPSAGPGPGPEAAPIAALPYDDEDEEMPQIVPKLESKPEPTRGAGDVTNEEEPDDPEIMAIFSEKYLEFDIDQITGAVRSKRS